MIKHKISLLLLGMLISFSACQDTIIPDKNENVEDSDDLVPVTLNLKDIFGEGSNTYSLSDIGDAPGTPPENLIADVMVYIFKSNGECEKILQGTGSSLPIGPELITTGVKDFVAVANITGNIMGLPVPGQESTINYAALMRKISDEKSLAPQSAFLMTGKRNSVSIPKQTATESQTIPVSIDVSRAVSKVTLNFTKSGDAAAKDIVITKLTLFNGADRVGLFETPNPNPTEYDIQTVCPDFNSYNGIVPVGTIPLKDANPNNDCIPLDTFYTYENLAGNNKSQATYFELEALVGGSIMRTCKVYLAEDPESSTDTVWNVKRNYWYDVFLDIIDPGFDSVYVTVNVSKWNEALKQQEEPGGGYEVEIPEPFKLVKNYTADELSSGNNGAFAAIETHTKGAAYIDLKVTEGVSWSLAFNNSIGNNVDAKMVLGADSATWDSGSQTSGWQISLTGIGDDKSHRIWIYRPYKENAEPKSGPALTLTVGGIEVRDFIVQPRDTVPVPTNCYIMRPQLSGVPANQTHAYIPLAGVYRFWEDEILENGQAIPDGPVTAELLWKDRTGDVVKNISVINANRRDSAYIYAEAGSVPGNAVVAMKVGNTIYWSFHLWVTEYNPYEVAGQKLYLGASNNIFMDRNLGALNNKYDGDGEARGLYYQFGRKDPYPRAREWDGGNNYLWFNASDVPLGMINGENLSHSYLTLRPRNGFKSYLENPLEFYTNVSADLQPWPLYTENNYLWDTEKGNKTAFDPCPEGWRIPKQDGVGNSNSPWKDISANFTPSLSGYENGRYHVNAGYYPYAGYISATTLSIGGNGRGYFWASWNGDGSGYAGAGLRISNTDVIYSDIPMDDGLSVRCVVDVNYLLNTEGGGLFGNSAGGMAEEIMP